MRDCCRNAAALGMALALAAPAAAQGRPATPDERARIQADYNRDLARLREAPR